MMIKELKMENILTGDLAALYTISKKVSEQMVQAQIEEDKKITEKLLAELDEIEALQAAKEEEVVDNFIADLENFVEEAEELHTQELLKIQEEQQIERDKNLEALDLILSEENINKYGNKTIKRHRELESKLNQIKTNSDKSIIEMAMSAYGCTYSQAVSKLAVRLNINYEHETWFKKQMEIIEHNKNLIENPMVIVIKHPQLWNKLKHNAHMRKYFLFLIDLFQTQLEQKGLSYKAASKPLIASASCGFISDSLRTGYKTAYINMNNLTMFGATKKLTNKEVKKIDESRYESIVELAKNNPFSAENKDVRTITTYELILWDDEVLEAMNDMVIEKQRTRSTNKGQCHTSLSAIGCDDVINKSTKQLSQEDKANIASLTKWARKKVFEKGGCGFITREDLESRFNNPENKNTIWAKKHIKDMYETIVMNKLGLSYEYVSKELKSLVSSKKLNKIEHGKVWVPVEIANKLNKYND